MRIILLSAVIIGMAVPAAAQERPFLFLTTTAEEVKPAVRFDYDVGIGEGAFKLSPPTVGLTN